MIPVESVGPAEFQAGVKDTPLKWCNKSTAYGKVNGLELTGSFLVDFDFHEEELKNWLVKYVTEEPEAALKMLSNMQALAIISLTKSSTDSDE